MKVFVTGLGVVSGIGTETSDSLLSLKEGRHGMGKVTLFPTQLNVPVSEVKYTNEQLKELLNLEAKATYSRTTLLGMLAAMQAWEDAEGYLSDEGERIGIISATSVGGMDASEQFYEEFKKDPRKGRLRHIASHDCADSTVQISYYLGIEENKITVSTACSSAANAIIQGAELIRAGKLDTVLVGGTDSLCRFTLNGFNSLMILDKEHCRPFDESCAGLNLGEGAGYLVLQSQKFCRRTPYCELTGYANANEAYHQTGSSAEGNGPFLSMSQAIAMSGIAPSEVGYISVHGTGTPTNDASEGRALQRIFGEHVPPFSSLKPFIGHTLGASGGIEAALSILCFEYGCIYPNLNFRAPIAATGLVPETTYRDGQRIKHVMSNSFGFGGNDTTLVFSAFKPTKAEKPSNKKVKHTPVYINSFSSIHPEKTKERTGHLSAQEPDYKSIITDANLRRRMSRIIKMGVASGLNCIGTTPPEEIKGIITATGWGCLTDTEKFLNAIIDQKEQSLNPTPFIQSTFNTIGAQIALLKQIQASNVTYVHRGLSFESALQDGMAKVKDGKGNILVGAMDEWTPTSHTILQRLGMLRGIQAGEGAQFFLLSDQPGKETAIEVCSTIIYTTPDVPEEQIQVWKKQGLSIVKDPDLVLIASAVSRMLAEFKYEMKNIDWYLTGENSDPEANRLYAELSKNHFPRAIHTTFKDECGEYPTATAYALWKVADAFKNTNHPARVALIHNSYQPCLHSFTLVRRYQP